MEPHQDRIPPHHGETAPRGLSLFMQPVTYLNTQFHVCLFIDFD